MDMFRLFLYSNTTDHCSSILKPLLPLDSITLFSFDTPFAFVAHTKKEKLGKKLALKFHSSK